MKASILLCLILPFIVERAGAQRFPTNSIGQAQAVKLASHLWAGMSEEGAAKILEQQNGLKLGSGIWVGPHSESTRCYLLSDSCFLELHLEPPEPQQGHTNRWLSAVSIQSNNVNIVSIALTNAP